jgi:hypothetical protein
MLMENGSVIDQTEAVDHGQDAPIPAVFPGVTLEQWVGALAVLLVTGFFLSLWWNRYLAPTFGGELFLAASAELGLIPFRDFYSPSPPGPLMLARALTEVGGDRLILFWILGALVRMVSAVALYLWLCRIARPAFAAFAVVATFVFASGDIADYPYFYNHMAVSCCLMGAWAVASACESVGGRRRFLIAVAGGVLLGWACTVKQTNGLISLAAIYGATSLVLWNRRDTRGLALILGGLTIGALLPLIAMAVWLERMGVLGVFVEQVFTKGPSSKGGLAVSLFRPILLTWTSPILFGPATWALIILGLGVLGYFSGRDKDPEPVTRWYWLATVLSVAAILIGSSLTGFPSHSSRAPTLTLCYLSLTGCLLIGTVLAARLLVLRKPVNAHHALLAAVGFSSAYALSMSWPAFEVMILPGVSYLLAASLQSVSGRLLAGGFRVTAILACLLIIVTVTWRKHMLPQAWGRWSEPPIAQSTVRPNLTALSGFVLSPVTANFFQAVTEAIVAHSLPTDRIFVYPNMPIFYGLSKRMPVTESTMHWVDVCPDYLARSDAKRLLANPPAVMVIHPDLPQELATEEFLFRSGKQSAVREVLAAVQSLLPRYDLVAKFPVSGHPVPVWVYSLKR